MSSTKGASHTGVGRQGVSRRRFLQHLGLGVATAGTALLTGPEMVRSVVAAASAPGSSTSATPPGQVRQGGTLVVAVVGDPSTFNPDLSTYNTNTLEMASSLFDTLVSYNRNWQVIPRLAVRWAASGDAKSYAFYLAKNAKWHDGQPVTADDVKWTFETIVSGHGWSADYLRDLDKIETPNPNTVRIDLKRPNAGFLISLAEKGMTILPKHLYQGGDWNNSSNNVTPVGSGPFKFVHYEKGSYVELAANNDYFRGRPYVDRLIFKVIPDAAVTVRAIEAGEVDYSTNFAPFGDVPRLEHDDRVRLVYYTAPVIAWLGFNLTRPPFNDLRVRQAIAYAIDKDELNQKSMDGKAVDSTNLYLEGHWATDASVKLPAYDPNMARQLLKASLGDRPLRFTLLTYQGFGAPEIAEVIVEQLRRVGVDVTTNALDYSAYIEESVQKKNFDVVFRVGFTGPDPSLLVAFVGTGGFQNVMSYSNPKLDALLLQGNSIFNMQRRAAIYSQVEQILLADMPRVPLFDRRVAFPVSPNYKDFWVDSSPEALKQAAMSYERAWWTGGKPVPPRS